MRRRPQYGMYGLAQQMRVCFGAYGRWGAYGVKACRVGTRGGAQVDAAGCNSPEVVACSQAQTACRVCLGTGCGWWLH